MPTKFKPTDAELDILSVLWEHGPCTVKDVHQQLSGNPPRGYTTVLKLMQIMHDKNLVRRDEKKRAHVYKAAIAAEQAQSSLIKHLLSKAFDNSTGKLVMQALASRPASKKELTEIRRLLDKIEGESK